MQNNQFHFHLPSSVDCSDSERESAVTSLSGDDSSLKFNQQHYSGFVGIIRVDIESKTTSVFNIFILPSRKDPFSPLNSACRHFGLPSTRRSVHRTRIWWPTYAVAIFGWRTLSADM